MKRHLIPMAGLGLAAVLALGACGADDNSSSAEPMGGMGHGSGSASSTDHAQAGGDVMFAQMMIPHHQQAIEMADLALENNTASAPVKALARQIKGAQDPEIQTMTRWLRDWDASPSPGAMNHGAANGIMSADDMAALEHALGAEFNRLWVTMMIQHHQGAITMARGVLAATSDAEVRSLAEAIVEGQEKEITAMRGMLG